MGIFRKFGSKLLLISITGFMAFFLALILSHTTPFRILELKTLDTLFELRGPIDASGSPIVLVAISEQADREIHERWPWPHRHHARLIDNLNRAGAKVIGIDVIFDQPDRFDPVNDTLIAHAAAGHGNVVTAGNILISRHAGGVVTRLVEPFPMLREYNPNPWGLVSVVNDHDGFLRRYALQGTYLDQTYNSFALELLRIYLDLDELEVEDRGRHFRIGPYTVPKFDHNTMLINYHGGRGSFLEFSYDQIIDDKDFVTVSDEIFFGASDWGDEPRFGLFDDPDFGLLNTGDLEDKIILVGSTMPELHDFFSTPFAPGNAMPGYEIHANALQTILSGNFIYNIRPGLKILVILFASLLASFITYCFNATTGIAGILIQTGLYLFLLINLFLNQSFLMEITGPVMGIFFSYTGAIGYNFITEQKEKKRIQGLFGSYVSPVLVQKMVDSKEEPNLGGEEVHMTAFFSDIVSFSAFSEQLPPSRLVDLINEYLTGMTDILNEHDGTLDKYIGDAIVAFFGAPIPMKDHAFKACLASQKMILKQQELREKWRSEGDKWPDIVHQMSTRIGINTGLMVTGNMGSTRRFNYTIMGDNVNLAARCESGAKSYGINTMITEQTKLEAEQFGDECVFRQLDRIVVMGRTKPVTIYEIAGLRSHLKPEMLECIEMYEEGLKNYFNQNWSRAMSLFEQSAKLEPGRSVSKKGIITTPSLVMSERCSRIRRNPPARDWDGVFRMTSK